MPKNTKAAGTSGEAFVRPFTDLAKDVELTHGVVVAAFIMPSGRKGVLMVSVGATRLEDAPGAKPAWSVANDWPHSTAQSLPAMLYKMMFTLARLVEEGRRDEHSQQDMWPK